MLIISIISNMKFLLVGFLFHFIGIIWNFPYFESPEGMMKLSCRDACGIIRVPTCTCDLRCPLVSNCCEDFAQECPHILNQSSEMFRYLSSSEISCDGRTELSTITSCPSPWNSNSVNVTTNMKIIDGMHNLSSQMNSSSHDHEWEKFENIFKLVLEKVPVYDIVSGFVYSNYEIFSCNTQGIIANPLLFRYEMKITEKKELKTLDELTSVFQSGDLVIHPPLGHDDVLKGLKCAKNIIDACPPEYNDTLISEKCREFSSYVNIGHRGRIFNNKYCVLCHGILTNKLTPAELTFESKQVFGLSYIFSLASYNQSSKLKLEIESSSWKYYKCVIDINSINPDTICRSYKCQHPAVNNGKGGCVANHYFTITFGDDGLPVTPAQKDKLHKFISCFLSRREKLIEFNESVYSYNRMESQYQWIADTVLHTIKFDGFLLRTEKGLIGDLGSMVLQLDLMSKMFFAFRLRKALQVDDTFVQDRTTKEDLYGGNYRKVQVPKILKYSMPNIFERAFGSEITTTPQWLNGSNRPSDFLVTTCACSQSFHPSYEYRDDNFCHFIYCWKSRLTSQEVEEILEMESSVCLDFLDEKDTATHHSSQWSVLLCVIMYLFINGV